MRDGQKIRLRGKGLPDPYGGEPGDLVVTVHVQPHPVFALDGNDVRVTVPVTFPEAALGARDPGSHPGRRHREAARPGGHAQWPDAAGQGPGRARPAAGDLLVTVQVAVPQRLDGDARAAVEAFGAATAGENPRADMMAALARHAGAGDGR